MVETKMIIIVYLVFGLTLLVMTLTYDGAFQYQDLVDDSFYSMMNTSYQFALWGFFCLGLLMIFHILSECFKKYENIFGGMIYVGLFGSFGILISTFDQVNISMGAMEILSIVVNGALVLLFMCIVFGLPIGFVMNHNDKTPKTFNFKEAR